MSENTGCPPAHGPEKSDIAIGKDHQQTVPSNKKTRLLNPPATANRIKDPRATCSLNHAVSSVVIGDHVAGFPRQHVSQDIVVGLHGVQKSVLDAQVFSEHAKGRTVLW